MDGGRRATKRVCLVYIITFVLLAAFFYYLMADNSKNNKGITRLREDVDDISHMLREQQRQSCPPAKEQKASKFSCIAGDPPAASGQGVGAGKCGDSRDMNAYVDTLIKRKIGYIMDDVYNLKKQVLGGGCANYFANQAQAPNPGQTVVKSRINYAAEELGARILSVLAKPIGGTNLLKSLLGLDFSSNPPVNILRSSLSPGACFGYAGSKAQVVLHLAKAIIVEAIALTHVAKEMTPSMCVNSAPKDFEVSGVPQCPSQQLVKLGQWTYDNAPSKRTQSYTVTAQSRLRDLIFTFTTNHGANSTCIYRVEVYGRLQ